MLTIAKTLEGDLIQASDAIKGHDYICVRCGKRLRLRERNGKLSFYHRMISSKKESEAESQAHTQAKYWLKKELEKCGASVILEKQLGNQRADVFVPPNYVYEVQISPLHPDKLWDRELGYRKQHLKTVWLLGERYYFSKQKTTYYPFLSYHPQLGFYYFEQHSNAIMLIYHITSDLNSVEKRTYHHLPVDYPKIQKRIINLKQQQRIRKNKIQRLRRQNTYDFRVIQTQWYLNHYSIDEMDALLSLPLSIPFKSFMEELKWKTCYFFENFNISKQIPVLSITIFQQLLMKEYSKKIEAFYYKKLKEYELW